MQLDINQQSKSLEQCISAALSAEQLDATESLRCPFTLEFRTTYRITELERLPPQLIIQLKRFTHFGKNNVAAIIPKFIKLFSSTQGTMHYSISAAIIHHGGLHQGHYTAITFSHDHAIITYCDDSSTRRISWASAETLLQQAYLLAYTRL